MNHFKKKNNKREKLRGIYFQIGLIIAGGLTLVAFEWSSPIRIATLGGEIVEEIEEDFLFREDFEIIEEKKEVEKVEKPKVNLDKIEIVPDEHKEEEGEEKEIEEKKEEKFNEEGWKEKEVIIEDPVSYAQHMPHYKDCASLKEDERKKCTQEKMYKHFGKTMRIPETIKMKGKASYMAFVYFEVNKKGKVTNVRILNDKDHAIPRELERQAYNAVSSLPEFVPAKNQGKKVKVLYRVPINFTVR